MYAPRKLCIHREKIASRPRARCPSSEGLRKVAYIIPSSLGDFCTGGRSISGNFQNEIQSLTV